MTLNLNYQQRINLVLLTGAQRGNVAEMRLFWGLQDRLQLTAEEKEAIGYQLVFDPASGMENPRWNHTKARDCAPLAFELTESEGQRLRRMLDEWPHFLAAVDRVWIEPLMEQLPVPAAMPAAAAGGLRM
jgi:hypothetical protein